jgi:hypothetical protein
MTFEPEAVDAALRAERYRRWAEQDRKMRVVGNFALAFGIVMLLLVAVDAIIKLS